VADRVTSVDALEEPYLRLRCRGETIAFDGVASYHRGTQPAPTRDDDSPFFSWEWDGAELAIRNDRYGFYPLFYYESADELALSPSILRLAEIGAPVRLDWQALAVFLWTGNYVGNDTPFLGIRILPPGAAVARTGSRFSIAGARPEGRPATGLSRAAAIEGYLSCFSEAVREMPADGEAVVPLSGGRDSRHIFLELHRQGVPRLQAVTVRYEPILRTDDMRVAKELAARASVPHVTVGVPWNTLDLERRKNRYTNLQTLEHRWILGATEELGLRHATVYEGVAGDTLSTAWGITPERLNALERGDLLAIADTYLHPEGYVPDVLAGAARRECTKAAARERIAAEFRTHLNAANPIGSFHVWNRTRRVTALAPCGLWNRSYPTWCPYLHRKVFDFLSSIPSDLLQGEQYHQFHTDAIRIGYPEFKDVPFSGKSSLKKPARVFSWLTACRLARYEGALRRRQLSAGRFVWARILRALVDPTYVRRAPSLLPLLTYLHQLEDCLERRLDAV
jgi:asparagine synthase (glutamine-hydrolysing)